MAVGRTTAATLLLAALLACLLAAPGGAAAAEPRVPSGLLGAATSGVERVVTGAATAPAQVAGAAAAAPAATPVAAVSAAVPGAVQSAATVAEQTAAPVSDAATGALSQPAAKVLEPVGAAVDRSRATVGKIVPSVPAQPAAATPPVSPSRDGAGSTGGAASGRASALAGPAAAAFLSAAPQRTGFTPARGAVDVHSALAGGVRSPALGPVIATAPVAAAAMSAGPAGDAAAAPTHRSAERFGPEPGHVSVPGTQGSPSLTGSGSGVALALVLVCLAFALVPTLARRLRPLAESLPPSRQLLILERPG